jgi:outer membrane protein TolC
MTKFLDKAHAKMKWAMLLLGLWSCSPVAAQVLRLDDAINIALKNSLEIEIAKNSVAQAKNNNYIGVAGGLPTVVANGSDVQQQSNIHQELNTGQNINRDGANVNTAQGSVVAGMLLYNGNRVWATKKRLSELEDQSEARLNTQVQNVMAAVMTAYYDVVRQQYFLKTILQSSAVAEQKLDLVKTQQKVGLANNADLFQSQLDLNTLQQSKQTQELIIAQAKAELVRLMHLPADSLITISDTILVGQIPALAEMLDHLPQNADIIAADLQVRINEARKRELAALRYPSLNANAGYNFNRTKSEAGQMLLNQSNGPYVGVTLGIPIYAGGLYKHQERAAAYDIANAQLQKDILLRDYSAAIVKSFESYQNNLQQVATQQASVALAQQLLDLILIKFKLHQATIIDVKVAQQSFETVSYTLAAATYAAKASEIELKRLMNKLEL